MASLSRRARTAVDIWPGWVDALSTLLIIIIFVLLVFVLGQFFLGQALSGRDQALSQLNRQLTEISDMLSLERQARAELELNLSRLSDELRSANQQLDAMAQLRLENRELAAQLEERTGEAQALSSELTSTKDALNTAAALAEDNRETIAKQMQDLALLQQQVRALEALKADLERQVAERSNEVTEAKLESAAAQAQAAFMSQQLEELQAELQRLAAALDAADKLTAEEKAQISDLGRRMNRALAGKVQELQRYRSEFFGRLRDILGTRPGITVVGDRFVFQSEVLFASGSAELGLEGQRQMAQLARTLLDIARQIPGDVDWILRVDGHTDNVPISTAQFPSNWELSTARALAVVRFLIQQGVPPDRLAAAGFGEFQPIETGTSSEARARNRRIELKLDQR